MKICAIICEYNPFHYGHLKNIKEAKEKSGADAIMCVLSGNFSQRSEPCIVNKYVRARMALEAGASIVCQMPTAYACSTAEVFALCGVKIANSFKNVTHLAFGCESENSKLLTDIAEYFSTEPKEYQQKLKSFLKQGNSMVVSRQKAVEELIKEGVITFGSLNEIIELLQQPNNILAIEYLKALKKINSKIKPIFIKRGESIYNSDELSGKDTSALAIRSRLYSKRRIHSVKKFMPKFAYSLLKEELQVFGLPKRELFDDLCLYVAKTTSAEQIKKVFDVSEGLENRISEFSKNTKDFNELLMQIKTKRYTYTRIKRIILHMLLGISSKILKELYNMEVLPFIKVLAFKSDNPELLKAASANTNLVIRTNNVEKNQSAIYKELAAIEDRANQIYVMLLKKNSKIPNYTPDLLTKSIKL